MDPIDDEVKRTVLGLLDSIKSEIVPEQFKLAWVINFFWMCWVAICCDRGYDNG